MLSTLGENSWSPVICIGEDRSSRWLVLCDHATNVVPKQVAGGDLGIAAEDMARHIAYDPGAAGVAIALAEYLDAPVVLGNFSRLVIDPNRGEDDPTLVMRLYDGTLIPGNRAVDADEVTRRRRLCYDPYHETINQLAARQSDTVIVSIHSFTPQLRHRPRRPWHIGLLYAEDTRLSLPLLELLRSEPGLVVGANEPYSGSLKGDTIDRHAISSGRQNTLVEIRNDLIQDDAGQVAWAERLARLLPPALIAAEAKGQ